MQSSDLCTMESLQVGMVEFPFNAESHAKCQISQTPTSKKGVHLFLQRA